MDKTQVHFDCTKNTLPPNWTNSNATAYYNRAFWKRCKCEYGTHNPCKETADKFNPVATEPNKWTKGCSPCSSQYNRPANYFYSYNPEDCGDCNRFSGRWPHNGKGNCVEEKDNDCCCEKSKKWNVFNNEPCGKCHKNKDREDCDDHDEHNKRRDEGLRTYVRGGCGDCNDVAVVYRMPNEERDCDNIVELRIPVGGSKEKYLARNFSPEFIYANRFQCATLPAINEMHNNIVDNRREEEFTVSDQAALTKRGINNALFAQQLIDEGKLIHDRSSFNIPMNVIGRSCYYYLGDGISVGSTATGLTQQDIIKGYFRNN